MAESLCCPPETTTALLIGYTPIKNKSFFFFFKKKRVVQGSPEYPLPGITFYLSFLFFVHAHTCFFWIIWKLEMSSPFARKYFVMHFLKALIFFYIIILS